MAKFNTIAAWLEERLARGDYALGGLPGERELAAEAGVTRMTVRRALDVLAAKGWVERRGRGRPLHECRPAGRLQLALLMPPAVSGDVLNWQRGIEQAAHRDNAMLRVLVYTGWSDALVTEALRGFDGVFFLQIGYDIPENVLCRIRESGTPAVALDLDLSARGIPSVWLFPPRCTLPLLDHLDRLGHRRVACYNTHPGNRATGRRIADWEEWKAAASRRAGALIEPPPPAGTPTGPDFARAAEDEIGRRLDEGGWDATALFCTSVWGALGAMKAARRRGLTVGRDLSVVTVNDEGLAPWLEPELTCLRMPAPAPLVEPLLPWIRRGGKGWRGPRLITPRRHILFKGGSAGPAPRP